MPEARSPSVRAEPHVVQASEVAAQNDNAAPLLELRPAGDGRAFVRALARVIVRGELIAAGVIATPDPFTSRRAG